MGLRCSVLGHRYGERERVEERDERGDEAVDIVREVKTCERCGDELIVSESKEVTAVDPPSPAETQTPEPESPPESEPHRHEPPDPEPFDPPEAGEDDAVIMPNEPDDRDPGEWPADPTPAPDELEADESSEHETDDDQEQWPEADGEDEGFDAIAGDATADDNDRIIEAVHAEDAEPVGENTEAGFFRAATINDPSDASDTDVHTEYYCPRCDWNAQSLVTSVRRGDICPSCRRGYVAERDFS